MQGQFLSLHIFKGVLHFATRPFCFAYVVLRESQFDLQPVALTYTEEAEQETCDLVANETEPYTE